MRKILLILCGVGLVAGCSSSGSGNEPLDPSGGSTLRLTLTLDPDEDAFDSTLGCPSGEAIGYLEERGLEACRSLEAVSAAVFEPDEDMACTEQYGGPETLRIRGEVDGERVDVTLDRVNGCGIAVWQDLGSLVDPEG